MLVATLSLVVTSVISRAEAYQGFSDPGPITVACMFIVAKALQVRCVWNSSAILNHA